MGKTRQAEAWAGPDAAIQDRVEGREVLEDFLRYLESIEIDLSEGDLTLEAYPPSESLPQATLEHTLTRTLDLEDEAHADLREAVENLVRVCQEAVRKTDSDFEPARCDCCVKSDCCWIDRIHLTEKERLEILSFLGEEDGPEAYGRYFEEDPDIGGFYRSMFRRVGGHCIFLAKMKDGLMGCTIYPVRPQVCRDFDAAYCDEWSKLLPRRSVRGPKS